ncbi:GntR family transcriptional regulator [Nocardiopsis changdeensis]|uniref:GntR family transcriptional regulator n=1 Tax=Nocardiopsis changdeensis TaxID=2831969 RepID=A0ABX8BE67_9ACTN|nr:MULTISPECIES: GntR family transcriptional regulator [Nocardiopsis]QUX20540.1 GntR family transcriptional regulator [Nocardiopsis changdeensis]QYX36471.1 GntR family transcriptional regulator [Nocardiopsis sp. MT53]
MTTKRVFSKSEYAYEEIKQRILTDALHPGAAVNQEGVAAELGISTTPVREAFKRLASEGLMVLATHKDARVSELTFAEAQSLYEIRLNIDPLAARWAAERRTDADVAAIRKAVGDLHPLTGTAGIPALTAHREFHRAVYRASHNQPMIEILDSLWDKADRYRQFTLKYRTDSEAEIERVRAEHQALADAVADGDGARAAEVMRAHISQSLGRQAMEELRSRETAGG